jgi:peptidoglycan/LPS O-acetylase OafA/YrhL
MHRGEHSYLLQNTGALALALPLPRSSFPGRGRSRPLRVVSLLEARPFVAVGVASYSLYLWHDPLIWWLRNHGMTLSGGWGDLLINLTIVAAVAGALSALTYRYVEAPALRRKRSTRMTPRSKIVIAGSAETTAAGHELDPAILPSPP